MFSGNQAVPTVSTTPPPRRQAPAAQRSEDVVPGDLDVRIEALKQRSPAPSEVERNPFRFQPKPPPPPPPVVNRPQFVAPVPTGPPEPPPPPPIGNTVKFIGIVQTAKGKIGAFSDCRATFPGREGEVIEGRYRVVKIGIESAELEYLDGKGRSTLPLNGSACVGR
ncbi:MAG: hypothetical protein ABIS06_07135 [Vicinamibacterales bacterium]